MKRIISLILIFSIILNGCASTSGTTTTPAQQQQNQEADEIIAVVASVFGVIIIACVGVAVSNGKKAKAKAQADEAKFQACVGKTKTEIYTIYGPPDSIVDDGLNDGGTILEYHTIITSGGGKEGVSTTTYRKMFYVNKDNVVTSVKEDSH